MQITEGLRFRDEENNLWVLLGCIEIPEDNKSYVFVCEVIEESTLPIETKDLWFAKDLENALRAEKFRNNALN